MDPTTDPDRALIAREAGPADIGPMHWLARRRNRFIVTEDMVVLVERGSLVPRVSHIRIRDIEEVAYRRRLSGGRMVFGSNILMAAIFLLASIGLQISTLGPAHLLDASLSPVLGLLLTLVVAVEATCVLLFAYVAEVEIHAHGVRYDLVCSGIRQEDIDQLQGLRALAVPATRAPR